MSISVELLHWQYNFRYLDMSTDNTSRSRRKYKSASLVYNSQYQIEHSFSILNQQSLNTEANCILDKVLTETTKRGLSDAKIKRNKEC